MKTRALALLNYACIQGTGRIQNSQPHYLHREWTTVGLEVKQFFFPLCFPREGQEPHTLPAFQVQKRHTSLRTPAGLISEKGAPFHGRGASPSHKESQVLLPIGAINRF